MLTLDQRLRALGKRRDPFLMRETFDPNDADRIERYNAIMDEVTRLIIAHQ